MNINFIARKAGVSKATVSRVMNRSKPVSTELEKKVMDAIKEYQYSPNSIARRLAIKRSFLICVLIEQSINQFQSVLIPHLSRAITSKGFQMVVVIVGDTFSEKLSVIKRMVNQNFDGIIALFNITEAQSHKIEECVTIPFSHSSSIGGSLGYYEMNRRAANKAVKYLIQLGHKRISGFFEEGKDATNYMRARHEGYLDAMKEADLPVSKEYLMFGRATMPMGKEYARHMLSKKPYPTALFCVSDELAIGSMLHLLKQSIRIPEDLSIMGFDGIPMGEQIEPALTTVGQPYAFWIEKIVDNLIMNINGRPVDEIPEKIIDKNLPQLIIRGSCSPPKT